MTKIISKFILALALILSQVNLASAQNFSCEIVFAGLSPTVSSQAQSIQMSPFQMFGLGGYIQCRTPQELAWNSFADRGAEQRFIMLELNPGLGGGTPESRAIIEQRLKDCYKLALIAMNNPARFMLYIYADGGQFHPAPSPNQLNIAVTLNQASEVGCALNVNSTGLR